MTFAEFTQINGLVLQATVRPYDMSKNDPFVWDCVLDYNGKQHRFEYRMGCAHIEVKDRRYLAGYNDLKRIPRSLAFEQFKINCMKPSAPLTKDVLYSLAMDCSTFINGHAEWEDFADEFGYNVDSIKDKKVFKACRKQFKGLRSLFGMVKLKELCECEE